MAKAVKKAAPTKQKLSLVDQLLKVTGEDGDIERLSESNYFKESNVWCTTGVPELDWNLRSFGFTKGIVEIAGESQSGKSTLSYTAMRFFQKQFPECFCFILSSEQRENYQYIAKIGVDTSKVIVIKSKFLEDLFYKLQDNLDAIEEIWQASGNEGKPKIMVVWDSVGNTQSRQELAAFKENVKLYKKYKGKAEDPEYKHAVMAAFAKQAKMHIKAITAQLYDKDILLLCLNVLTANLASPVGGKTSPGGSWLEFNPYMRFKMARIGWEYLEIDGEKEKVAQYTKVQIEKNDFGTRRNTIMEICVGAGIVLNKVDIAYAIEKGILKQEGAKKISFLGGKLKWSTKREFYNLYKEGNKLLPILHEKIIEKRHADIAIEKQNINSPHQDIDDEDDD